MKVGEIGRDPGLLFPPEESREGGRRIVFELIPRYDDAGPVLWDGDEALVLRKAVGAVGFESLL